MITLTECECCAEVVPTEQITYDEAAGEICHECLTELVVARNLRRSDDDLIENLDRHLKERGL